MTMIAHKDNWPGKREGTSHPAHAKDYQGKVVRIQSPAERVAVAEAAKAKAEKRLADQQNEHDRALNWSYDCLVLANRNYRKYTNAVSVSITLSLVLLAILVAWAMRLLL